MSVRVVGAGFGRTGTKSLQDALEILEFGPCYHMETLLENPYDLAKWKGVFTQNDDWCNLLQGYQSIVDFPACLYAVELYKYYPGVKVILTTRDAEDWYESTQETIYKSSFSLWARLKLFLRALFTPRLRMLRQVELFVQKEIWRDCFKGQFKNKELAISIYNKHIEMIKREIPEKDLLLFDVKDGWQPLCDFLGVEKVPSEVFPQLNPRFAYHKWIRKLIMR